ncbi:MAG: hypothetical protein A3K19_06860 [Lentisphaerae bacterium RIFOXYB12_FULL_65_16]|nr:MAG: hypothetical protein A3K18_20050 [Lentisphaerae bacterium RIFOXYA12_64_32]OGV93170.1 MAG: hypothetical protein A3K19_06860 [Lentisphaerae bacterium RIFOXYB12_FULL_65_16]
MFEHGSLRAAVWWMVLGVVLAFAGGVMAADNAAQVQGLIAKLKDENQNNREYAAKALVGLAPAIQPAIPALTELLADKAAGVRYNAAQAIGLVGLDAKSAIPALAASLKLNDWAGNAQSQAAIALGRMGPPAAEAAPALAEMLAKDTHPMARCEAARALGSIGPGAVTAKSALETALKDENGFVRVAAAAALWQVAQDAQGVPLLVQALEDPTIVGVRVAADALAELGAGAQPAVPALTRALQDPAACARVAAARALWRVAQDSQGVPALTVALGDESEEVRKDAVGALRLIAQEAKGPVAGVAEALKQFDAAQAAPVPADKAQPLVFETEDWTGPADAIVKDKDTGDKWKFATNDKRWTRNTVLVSPGVPKDRATPEEGAPVLHTHITGIPNGTYDVTVAHSRPLAVSRDGGTTWKKLDDGDVAIGKAEVSDGTFDLWVDDRYASSTSIGGSYYDYLTFTPAFERVVAPVQGWATERFADKLDRGLTAVRTPPADVKGAAAPVTGQGPVYLSWRLLPDDPPDIAFDVLRQDASGTPQRLNQEPISRTTDFVDDVAPVGAECRYTVVLARQPKDRVTSPPAVVAANAALLAYTSIKFRDDCSVQKLGIADLDGDGRPDFVIKQPDQNIDPYYTYWSRSPTTHKLEAYRADGSFMWCYDLGWGIEVGVWFSPFIIYDLDGDGRAEVICKASAGDPRDAEGKVFSGPEYVLVLDGATGKERCRADWPSREGFKGESAHNLAARNQLGIAYLDGKTPCLIVERGTYSIQKVTAFQMRENRLEQLWAWDNRPDGRRYQGQGAHTLRAADVDGDGRDEVILGSSVLDDNGLPLWSTGLGHPDCIFVGELDPRHPGLEIFNNIEPGQKANGFCMIDARTGTILWGLKEQSYHMGMGVTADIDAAHPGCECWAGEDAKSAAFKGAPPRWLYSAQGEELAKDVQVPPFGLTTVYWDADPQRELIQSRQVRDYQGGVHVAGVEGSVMAIADIAGDWREEIVTVAKGELRIYQTTVPADWRQVTLWADPIYRLDIAAYSSGYSGVPSTTFCLAETHASVAVTGPDGGLAPDVDNACSVVVTAPGQGELSGTLSVTVGSNATVTPASIPVKVAAGASERYAVTVRLLTAPSVLDERRATVFSSAVLTPERGSAVSARASLVVADRPLTGVPLAQAEAFVEQSGGEVRLRDDKPGASEKATSHWDNRGHKLTWRIETPQDGKYHLVIRYAWNSESRRALLVDGKPLPGAEQVLFPPSDGGGGAAGDWGHYAVRTKAGQLAVLTLAAGPHAITMENVDGRPLNLDYLALLPVR